MLNRLDILKIFAAAATAPTFREAAARLGVSPQVVTRAVRELEEMLGETLLAAVGKSAENRCPTESDQGFPEGKNGGAGRPAFRSGLCERSKGGGSTEIDVVVDTRRPTDADGHYRPKPVVDQQQQPDIR